jgi:hypothetical protein
MNINKKLNRKGAISYTTTGNPILDIFLHQNIIIENNNNNSTEIVKLIELLEIAFEYNPELYCKCILYHRQTTTKKSSKGNGYKLIFYLGMLVLRYKNLDIYKEMLVQSIEYGYFKDILRLLKLVNFINKNQTILFKLKLSNLNEYNSELDLYQSINQFEIQLYAELLYQSLKNIKNNNLNYNPFLFKYISNEKGTFHLESKQIWNYTEYLFNKSN